MSVVVETTLGDITVDLFTKERPRACQNFLKLCKAKYYNFNLFHTVSRGFIAQTGDPTGSRNGGESIFGVMEGPLKRFFTAETNPIIKHTIMGLISFVGNQDNMIGSQFFFTLGDELTYLDGKHCVFGQVTEGLDVLELINEAICDTDDRPYQDIRITHTVILHDPLPDLEKMVIPSRSPSPSAERLQGGRIAPDEEIDETVGKSIDEVNEMAAEREAKARATILEMVGDLPDADMAPPENVLFVCKLNPVTTEDDLEIIFSRFGKIKSCEVIRDHKSGDSLQYAFIEFEEQKSCEDAYFKMDNVLIDDRRIHVDFSQSVAKVKWMGKGRGVKHFNEEGVEQKNNREKNTSRGKTERYKNSYSSDRKNKEQEKRYSDHRLKNDYKRNTYSKSESYRERRRSRSKSPYKRHSREEIERYKRNTSRNGNTKLKDDSKSKRRDSSSEDRKFRKNSSKTRRERSVSPEKKERRNRSEEDKLKKKHKSRRRSTSSDSSSSSEDEKRMKRKKDHKNSNGKMEERKLSKKKHNSRRRSTSSESSSSSSEEDEKRAKRKKDGNEKTEERKISKKKYNSRRRSTSSESSSSSSDEDEKRLKRKKDHKNGNEKKEERKISKKKHNSRRRSTSESSSSSSDEDEKKKRYNKKQRGEYKRSRSTSPRRKKR